MPAAPDPESLPRQPAGPPPLGAEQNGQPETFGPVTVTRYLKGDGRALILYTHMHGDGTIDETPT